MRRKPYTFMRMLLFVAGFTMLAAAAAGQPVVTEAEMQALDRAIARELNSNQLGSQTLGDLNRLRHRLRQMLAEPASETRVALQPLDGDDSQSVQLERLEREAANGGRAAQRSLSLYYLFLNEPEKALSQWRQMGRANEYDLSFLLISAYLEFMLGEYDDGRRNLETALRLMENRASLSLGNAVFCHTVAGYRIYTERPAGLLLPGEDVLIYVEIEGASFEDTGIDGTTCELLFGLRLRNANGSTVWAEGNYGQYAPTFSGPIRDLHAALTWRVPNDLEAGRYTLLVEAVEDSSKRRGETMLEFEVGRRETNPETRPTGSMVPQFSPGFQDAQRAFPGAPVEIDSPTLRNRWLQEKQFEILQEYEQQQRAH